MKKERNLLALLMLCLLLLCLPVSVQADEVSTTYQEGDFVYTVTDGEAYLTEYVGSGTDVVVPAALGGYPLVGITRHAFSHNETIQTLTFSEGIVSFSYECVYLCRELREVTYPASANLSDGLPVDCLKLEKVNIPADNSSAVVCDGAVYSKNMKTLLLLPAADPREVFTVAQGVTGIGDNACENCVNLREVVLPEGLTFIGYWSFLHCDNLEKVEFPETTEMICQFAFDYTALKSIHIPASVTWVMPAAFGGNCCLEEITVDADNPSYYAVDDVLYQWGDSGDALVKYPIGSTRTEFTVPDGVCSIMDQAFANADHLVRVDVPGSVKIIWNQAFYSCGELKTLSLSHGLETIDDYAFLSCHELEDLVIPASVTYVGNWFVWYLENQPVTFLGEAPEFHPGAFKDCTCTVYYLKECKSWTEEVRQDYGGDVTWKALDLVDVIVPAKPYKIANVVSGVHVYWDEIAGASKYGLWRSETGAEGTYKWVANPRVPHFTDTAVESGKTYYYKVTAMDASGAHTRKSEPIGITYMSTPDITSRANTAAGIQLGWEKVPGATGYAIYRKSYDGGDAWVRIGTIPGNATFSWTDTTVKNNNGQVYKYTIRALAGSNMRTLSGCRNAGRTMARLSSQTLTSAAAAGTGSIRCKWTTSARVDGYEVRFLVDGAVYKTFTIGNYKTGVKTFTGLEPGQPYTIQVRTYKKVAGVGGFYSAWSAEKNVDL